MGQCDKAIDARLGNNGNLSTMPPVATIGSPPGDKAFSPEADTTVTSVAGKNFNGYSIDKH